MAAHYSAKKGCLVLWVRLPSRRMNLNRRRLSHRDLAAPGLCSSTTTKTTARPELAPRGVIAGLLDGKWFGGRCISFTDRQRKDRFSQSIADRKHLNFAVPERLRHFDQQFTRVSGGFHPRSRKVVEIGTFTVGMVHAIVDVEKEPGQCAFSVAPGGHRFDVRCQLLEVFNARSAALSLPRAP